MPGAISKRKETRKASRRAEYVTEGELTIKNAYLLIDDCYLSEFVQRHFQVRTDSDGWAKLGRVQIIISRVHE